MDNKAQYHSPHELSNIRTIEQQIQEAKRIVIEILEADENNDHLRILEPNDTHNTINVQIQKPVKRIRNNAIKQQQIYKQYFPRKIKQQNVQIQNTQCYYRLRRKLINIISISNKRMIYESKQIRDIIQQIIDDKQTLEQWLQLNLLNDNYTYDEKKCLLIKNWFDAHNNVKLSTQFVKFENAMNLKELSLNINGYSINVLTNELIKHILDSRL